MDPYVVITVGQNKQKTKVQEDGGKRPNWQGESFQFRIEGGVNEMVTCEVWDRNHVKVDA